MRHQELSAALQEALAEAKRKFNAERQNDLDTETTTPSYVVCKKGVRVSYQKTAGRTIQAILDVHGVQIGWRTSGGYHISCSTTYTWEELLP